jgi:hypothetical protein
MCIHFWDTLYIFIIIEGNIKNENETDVNKRIILALVLKRDCAKLRSALFTE